MCNSNQVHVVFQQAISRGDVVWLKSRGGEKLTRYDDNRANTMMVIATIKLDILPAASGFAD